MFDSVIRRVASAVQSTVRATPATTPTTTTPTTTPVAAPFSQDSFVSNVTNPLNLDGYGDVPDVLERFIPESVFGVKEGPEFLHLKDEWIPQGQGYDSKNEEILTSYYNEDHEVLLSRQGKKGKEAGHVILGGTLVDPPRGGQEPESSVPPPGHGGGVATDGKFVYVADTEGVYVYSREAVARAEKGETVPALDFVPKPYGDEYIVNGDPTPLINKASYMTVKDGYAYVGSYSANDDDRAGAVWRYKITENGIDPASVQGPIRAPDQAQGVTVVDGALLFTTGSQKLYYQPITSTEDTFAADIDDREEIGNGFIDQYAQGLNVIDGELWVTYESGADPYKDKPGTRNPRDHIQRIPLERLDLEAAGLTPEDLEG
jgi:hypothetical protein